MANIFIHIGMPKTASTSMQKMLKINEYAISKQFYIPKSCQTSEIYINHSNLFCEFSGDSRFKPDLGNFNNLLNEIKNVKKDIILSSEDFSLLLLNDKHKFFFEKSLKDLNFKVTYLCFYRNEISYFYSVLKELKEHRLRQPTPFKRFNHFHDLVHFKNALINGWVIDDLYQRDFSYKMFFDIKKFKKIIENNSLFKFKYFKHEKSSLIKFAELFGIKRNNLDNFKLNVAHKNNIKNYLYSIPGFILYMKYKKNIKEDQVSYLLNEN
jgi:hypothetical protein